MSDTQAPSGGGSGAPDWAGRLERIEAAQRRVRMALVTLVVGGLAGLAATIYYFETRHLAWRADTIIAHRFVLEHDRRTRAELSMHRAGFAQFLLGPDDRYRHGVAISERGDLVVRGDSGSGIYMLGSQLRLHGDAGALRAGIEAGSDGHVWWAIPDPAARAIRTWQDGGLLHNMIRDSVYSVPPR